MGWIIPTAIVGFLLVILGLRLLAGNWDRQRIADYVRERGGRVVRIKWAPFGHGWFGDESNRIYEVTYDHARGERHLATCKTSLFGGAFWTEDRVVSSRPANEVDRLREENAQLRAEVERLRAERNA